MTCWLWQDGKKGDFPCKTFLELLFLGPHKGMEIQMWGLRQYIKVGNYSVRFIIMTFSIQN